MSTIKHIRKSVLGISQIELAAIAGANQATVSRWEAGSSSPTLEELGRIRNHVITLGLDWSDSWLFDAPPAEASAEPAQ